LAHLFDFILLRMHFHFCTPAHTHTHRHTRALAHAHSGREIAELWDIEKKVNKTFSLPPCARSAESFTGFRSVPAGQCIKCNRKSIISPFHTRNY